MSHKILVSPKFISIGIVITKIVQSGNYPNSHKYTTVINIKVLSCGKKYWRFSFVLSPSVKSGKQKEIWGGKKRYLEKFEVLSLKFDIKKWYSLRSFSLIPLSKTHVDQNMKKGETGKAFISEQVRLMALSCHHVTAPAPASLQHLPFLAVPSLELPRRTLGSLHRGRAQDQTTASAYAVPCCYCSFCPLFWRTWKNALDFFISFPPIFILLTNPGDTEIMMAFVHFML